MASLAAQHLLLNARTVTGKWQAWGVGVGMGLKLSEVEWSDGSGL
jgi:hypothetical protein